MTTQDKRSEFWRQRWDEIVQQKNPFSTMGRSSDTMCEYFAYIADIVNGLDGVDRETVLLDAAGGCGYLSMYFSPLVKEVHLFDYSSEAIKRAESHCAFFDNIKPYVDNLLDLNVTRNSGILYKKVLVGSVLQYFDNAQQLDVVLKNIHDISENGARIFVSQTPDLSKKAQHIASYHKLGWPQEKVEQALFEENNNRLWVDFVQLKQRAQMIGFSECVQTVNNPNLFQSSHMFDFYLVK